ncbi:LysR family transcriptional regulator [Paenibacillus sp. 2KB_22]|uniref:LysR family transcriptional regulator n=1 Tax=Paenibacillus sp. 2KB_22 TaxID=3232978 RepID=UPI003F9E75D6
MELLQLRYFKTVARLEHMSQAAEELHISQPSLSKTIALLEKELGIKLFDRRGKNIQLNEYGKLFYKRVDESLVALENGKRELADLKNENHGEIKLMVLTASHLLPNLLTEFRKVHPYISFQLLQHSPHSIIRPDFDLCIGAHSFQFHECESTPLLTEEIFIAVPKSHDLGKEECIHLSKVANEGFISLRSGANLRELTDEFCRNAGFSPRIIFESDDPSMVRGLINAEQGVGFIPEVTWGGSTGSSVNLLRISQPSCQRTITLSWKQTQYFSKPLRLFKDFTIQYFAQLSEHRQ